jgi:hypothetical protein
MKLVKLRWVVPVIVMIFVSGPAFAAAGLPTTPAPGRPAPTAPAAPVGSPSTAVAPASAAAGQMASYAQREQQAAGLQNFKGGVGIYIGGSVVVLLLVLILLVLIL